MITRYPKTPVWRALSLGTNCSNFAGGYQSCAYWKDEFGIVHLHGLVHYTGTPATGQVLGTLPAGFRPTAIEQFAAAASGSSGDTAFPVEIDTAGNIIIYFTTTTWTGNYVTLSGITFDSATPPA